MPRTMIIMRGPPGSGKSTLVKLLKGLAGARTFSLDRHRVVDGEYKFIPWREREVVALYNKEVEEAIKFGYGLIILDNVHSRKWEYLSHYEGALKAGYRVHVVEVQSDIFECFSRQQHPVPFNKLREIFDRWETPLSRTKEDRLDQAEELLATFFKEVLERPVCAVTGIHKFHAEGGKCLYCNEAEMSPPSKDDELSKKLKAALDAADQEESPSPEHVSKSHDHFHPQTKKLLHKFKMTKEDQENDG